MTSPELAVGPGDEGLHTPVGDPLWSESFYLNFSDASGRCGGFTRIALLPTGNKTEGLLCLYLPGGGVGITLDSDRLEQPDKGVVRAHGLAHQCIEPLQRWRIQYNGDLHLFDDPAGIPAMLAANEVGGPDEARPTSATRARHVELDLEITGLHAPFFYPNYRRVTSPPPHREEGRIGFARALTRAIRRPGEIRSALRMRSGRHYEQSVRVRGSMTMAGERFDIDGMGHRDHSWGLRDWAPSQRWRWLTGQMDGLAFNAMYLTIAGTHVTNGYVWRDGRSSPLDDLRLEATFDETGLGGRTVRLELTAGGEPLTITGDVLMNVPLPITGAGFSTMYNVGWTRYRCGDRVGYGVAEFLERLYP